MSPPAASHARRVVGLAPYRVHERFADVEIEHVPEFVRLGVLLALSTLPMPRHRMIPKAIATQPREEITERLLPDAPEPAGGETHAFLIALDEPALFELVGHALQAREVARGVVTEDVAQGFFGGVVERLTAVHPAQARVPAPRSTAADP